jgi:hypothetical protein
MDRWVQRAADVVTVVVGLLVLAIVVPPFLAGDDGPTVPIDVRLDIDVDFASHSRTLVMALDSECVFCAESMPFYRRLVGIAGPGVQIVIAAMPSDTGIEAYLASEGLKPDGIVFVSDEDVLPVSATPTLLLADADGVVTHAWVGLLSASGEAEVITQIGG